MKMSEALFLPTISLGENGAHIHWGSLVGISENKHKITTWPGNSTPTHICKRIESREANWILYTSVHSSIVTNSQKGEQPKGPSVDKRISTMWYVNIMEYHSAIKRSEVLIHVDEPKNVLKDRRQTQKVTCYMTPLIRNIQNGQSHGDSGCQAGGRGTGEWLLTGYGVSFGDDENVLELAGWWLYNDGRTMSWMH